MSARKNVRRPSAAANAQTLTAMTFQAWPEAIAAVGTAPAWAAEMREKANPLVIGLHALGFDDVALTDRFKCADEDELEAAVESAEWLNAQAAAFRGLAAFCEAASLRLMCACMRIALERQAAGEAQP